MKTIAFTGTTTEFGTLIINRDGVEASKGATFLYAIDSDGNYYCKLYAFTETTVILGISTYANINVTNETHTIYSTWLIPIKYI